MKRAVTLTFLILFNYFGFSQNRVAIVEDFRGHKCGLCPGGDLVADQIVTDYDDSVIVVAIHAGSLASPNSSGTHTTDFRTAAGDYYNTKFGIISNPKGLINRTEYNGDLTLSKGSWVSAVEEIIDDQSKVDIEISNGFDSLTREITISTKTMVNENLSGNYNLTILVLEDSIYDWQTDYNSNPQNVEFYLFNHVLRDDINGVDGVLLIDSIAIQGDSLIKEYSYTLNENWDEEQISLVAYLSDNNTDEILQASKIHLNIDSTPIDIEEDTVVIIDTIANSTLDIKNSNLVIYPNPSKGMIYIESDDEILAINVFDLQGVKMFNLFKDQNSIDLTELNNGFYIVEIKTQKSVYINKVMKK